MKPNFLCVGAQKAGTTTLHDILKQHPDIYLPKLKEAHFFDRPERYIKGIRWWLETFFEDYNNEKIMGAITPEYLYYEEVPEKIFHDLRGVKLIIILRNPVDRAYSHYLMSKRRSYETLPFEEAILAEPERLRVGGDFERNHFSYIDRGRYAVQLKRYYNLFKQENIMVLIFEDDIKRNIDETIGKIERFLDIEQLPLNTKLESNSAREPKNMVLNQLLHSRGQIKKVIGRLIPFKNIKRNIKQWLVESNMKSVAGEKAILSETLRQKILRDYFVNDIAEVETIVNINLDIWTK